MPNGWKITIHGGFAWVFENDDVGGRAGKVTVGPYRKPNGHPRYHPHRMVLRVPERHLNQARTTLPYQTVAGNYVFELRDTVTLNAAATGEITRTISTGRPKQWNDFYWVYDADRFRDRTGKQRTPLAGNWRNRLLARLELQGGDLEVLPSSHNGVYRITYGKDSFEQPLATHIAYHPRWPAPPEVEFQSPHGVVAATPADFEIAADCGCSEHPFDGEIAGFDLTFDLYQNPAQAPRFTPLFKGSPPPASANSPGGDCPPRSYSA
jgi:hypothetical protein